MINVLSSSVVVLLIIHHGTPSLYFTIWFAEWNPRVDGNSRRHQLLPCNIVEESSGDCEETGMRLDFFTASFGSRSSARACDYRGAQKLQSKTGLVFRNWWVFMNGEQGKWPGLVRPRLSFRDCADSNDAKVKVLTMYGDGFCMVQHHQKDCLYSNLRIFGPL